MSAIWGVIERSETISEKTVNQMQDSMKAFKIDDYQKIVRDSEYFACGKQYFTKESVQEDIPFYDSENGVLFTADCVLTNRGELIQLLEPTYPLEELEACGDGQLSYKAYLVWGEEFVKRLRGSFAFAIYHVCTEKLLLYADHFARRYLTYCVDEQRVLFSTLYQPILAVLDKEQMKLNRAWIVSAYSDCTADTIKLHGDTVYQNIFHVEPGQYIRISLGNKKIEKVTYWNPLQQIKKVKLDSDEEYKELFLSTFQNAVRGLLRTNGEVGIMLSGGLDSSSVAALTAIELKERGKNLYSYTAVPTEDYPFVNTRLTIENETEFVRAQQEMHPNIKPRFVSAGEINCFTDMEEYASYYMEPVKPILNMAYSHGMMEKAAEDGCKLMLSGQNGNATISYGGILTYIYQKICRMHWLEAYRGMNDFCKMHRTPRKRLLKIFLKTLQEEKIKKYHVGEDCFLSKEDLDAFSVEKRERDIMKSRGTGYMDSVRQRRGFGFMPLVYQHMGFYDTYDSLKYGILSVDPTLTKEMVELCLGMPIDCFVQKGKERRAIRDYMKGYVPDMILDNYSGRGVQAADYSFRVNRDWEKIKDKVYELLGNPVLLHYLDENKLKELMEKVKENRGALDKALVAEIAVLSSLSAFLNIMD